MTRKEFVSQIVQSVQNATNEKDANESVNALMDVVEPTDRVSFARWGYLEDRSTPETCWDN